MQSILKISCGLDIHKDTIEACILVDNGSQEPTIIRETFTTLRGDLIRLRFWLDVNNCKHVAMESTGVYWKPIYEILEEVDNINLCLVNAHHMRNLPGRKTDVKDAEWIATLFMFGLLNPSYVPRREVRIFREYSRFYKKLVEERTRHVNRLEKFLQTHGFKLSSVISDILGVSGRKLLEKLCTQGYVSVSDVFELAHKGLKKTADEIAYAINGNLAESERLLLKLLLDTLYMHEKQIEISFKQFQIASEPFKEVINLIDQIPGIDILSAMYILAEIGDDMSAFKTESHITSWAGLCPRNDESAGKIKSNKILKGNTYVKSILCQCAWAAVRVRNTRISNWFWRNVKRLGEKKAIIAVARKLLVYIYHMIITKKSYDSSLDVADTERLKALKLESAKQQVACLDNVENNNKVSVKSKVEKITKIKDKAINKKNCIEEKSPNLKFDTDNKIAPKKRGRPKKILQ